MKFFFWKILTFDRSWQYSISNITLRIQNVNSQLKKIFVKKQKQTRERPTQGGGGDHL